MLPQWALSNDHHSVAYRMRNSELLGLIFSAWMEQLERQSDMPITSVLPKPRRRCAGGRAEGPGIVGQLR